MEHRNLLHGSFTLSMVFSSASRFSDLCQTLWKKLRSMTEEIHMIASERCSLRFFNVILATCDFRAHKHGAGAIVDLPAPKRVTFVICWASLYGLWGHPQAGSTPDHVPAAMYRSNRIVF
eukprot:scaffold6242_cov88-Cylindrotheca_fusiformis.AAC.1